RYVAHQLPLHRLVEQPPRLPGHRAGAEWRSLAGRAMRKRPVRKHYVAEGAQVQLQVMRRRQLPYAAEERAATKCIAEIQPLMEPRHVTLRRMRAESQDRLHFRGKDQTLLIQAEI